MTYEMLVEDFDRNVERTAHDIVSYTSDGPVIVVEFKDGTHQFVNALAYRTITFIEEDK